MNKTLPRTLAEIRAVVSCNVVAGRPAYSGLDSSEISEYTRLLGRPVEAGTLLGNEAWSQLVD